MCRDGHGEGGWTAAGDAHSGWKEQRHGGTRPCSQLHSALSPCSALTGDLGTTQGQATFCDYRCVLLKVPKLCSLCYGVCPELSLCWEIARENTKEAEDFERVKNVG